MKDEEKNEMELIVKVEQIIITNLRHVLQERKSGHG
jgi:hypothetical protein